jgi:hypothetical protein
MKQKVHLKPATVSDLKTENNNGIYGRFYAKHALIAF